MAIIDIKNKVIKGKIVYYGPAMSGKTTNLEYINRTVKDTQEMVSLATEGDRTIFFDFLPMNFGEIRGISTVFKLYTVPGQVKYNLTRKMVLKNVDGVVFVADSQQKMYKENVESLKNLFANMKELGIKPETIPIVFQYNKRDLENILPSDMLNAVLNKSNHPFFPASAITGEGVLETLKSVSKTVFTKLSSSFGHAAAKAKKPAAQSGIGKKSSIGENVDPSADTKRIRYPQRKSLDSSRAARHQEETPQKRRAVDTVAAEKTRKKEETPPRINQDELIEKIATRFEERFAALEAKLDELKPDGSQITRKDIEILTKAVGKLAQKQDSKSGANLSALHLEIAKLRDKVARLPTTEDIETLREAIGSIKKSGK